MLIYHQLYLPHHLLIYPKLLLWPLFDAVLSLVMARLLGLCAAMRKASDGIIEGVFEDVRIDHIGLLGHLL